MTISKATSKDSLNLFQCQTEKRKMSKKRLICSFTWLILGLISAICVHLLIRYDLLEVGMTERIRVRPGFPAYEKWKKPPSPLEVKLYLFGTTNAEAFLNGTDKKLNLEEIGPIIYYKRIRQNDIVFNDDDSTLSFTTTYDIEYPEDKNIPGILNKSIIIPNPMMLGVSALINNYNNLFKTIFNMVAMEDKIFLNRTVYEILWKLTSPTLENIKKYTPSFVVPRDNAGILFNSFFPTVNRYNVNIGPAHGFEKFFQVNTLNSLDYISKYSKYFPEECPFSLKGASEGTSLPPFLTKESVIYAYTSNLCRTYPMVFNREIKYNNLDTYEFKFHDDIYRRLNSSADCLKKTGDVELPNGLIDSSKCAFGTPVALSQPHFYGFDGEWNNYLSGLKPSKEKHFSSIIVEPKTGIQLYAAARIQSNLALPVLTQSTNINRFSNMIVPTFWMEYGITFEDTLIISMVHFFIYYLPVVQPILLFLAMLLTVVFILKSICSYFNIELRHILFREKRKEMVYPTNTFTADKINYLGTA